MPTSANLNLYSKDYLAFWYLWISRIFIVSGFQIICLALSWQMYMLTHNAFDLGLVGLLQFLPRIFLVLVAGLIVDRFDRRKIIAITLTIQALISFILILASIDIFTISKGLILSFSILIGICSTFDMPAMASLLPDIVPKNMLSKAIAAASSARQIATIAAPALGGLLYSFGAGFTYTITFLSYVIGIVFILLVPKVIKLVKNPDINIKAMLLGIDYIFKRKDILGAISLDLFVVLLGGATALLPIFAHDILHISTFGLGVLRSAPAVGALLMSLYLIKFPMKTKVGKKMFIAVCIFGISTIFFGLSSSYLLSFLSLIILGASDMISVVIRTSFIQLNTPPEMRGRVNSVNSLFIGASNQLGEFESGVTADWWGAKAAVVIGGVGTFAIAVAWMKLFPSLLKRDTLE